MISEFEAIVWRTYDFTQHLELLELPQLSNNSRPYSTGLSDTVSPLLITPPSLAVIVNIIRFEQDADPVGSAISLLGQLIHTQEELVHFSHFMEWGPRVKADRKVILSPLLIGELCPWKKKQQRKMSFTEAKLTGKY